MILQCHLILFLWTGLKKKNKYAKKNLRLISSYQKDLKYILANYFRKGNYGDSINDLLSSKLF